MHPYSDFYPDWICRKAREKEAELESFTGRIHPEGDLEIDGARSGRNPFYRDYARILYSSSFRRLQGKMQLLEIDAARAYRNRLTHSLEVAQTARGIAYSLRLEEPVVCEAAALAHDLGNPPFGHYGEDILDRLAKEKGLEDGFEGNAQSFRILCTLEKKSQGFPGLNLTQRTLLAVLKYFAHRSQPMGKRGTKHLYDGEYESFCGSISPTRLGEFLGKRTIDAQIMDLADEISYAAHDLEDILASGIADLREFIFEIGDEEPAFRALIDELDVDFQRSARRDAETGGLREKGRLWGVYCKELSSRLVNRLLRSITWDTEQDCLSLGDLTGLSAKLKQASCDMVMGNGRTYEHELRASVILTSFVELFTTPRGFKLLPRELSQGRDLHDDPPKASLRAVFDYLGGMMDTFAIEEYRRYVDYGFLDKVKALDVLKTEKGGPAGA